MHIYYILHTCVYMCVCVCVYIYKCVYTHTHTHSPDINPPMVSASVWDRPEQQD